MDRVKRIWYLSPMRAAKVQASLRIRAVSPEPSLLAHTSSESRGTFRQKARSLAPLNGWACAVKICHYGMLEDTNSLDAAHIIDYNSFWQIHCFTFFPYKGKRDKIWPCCKIGQGQSKVIIWTYLVVLQYPRLHINFQGHQPFGSREDFFWGEVFQF